jgi:Na+-driven multidrug efflux pump
MTDKPAASFSKGRLLLNSFFMALISSCGYLIVAVLNQHDPMWIAIGMAGITVLLTPIFYALNLRRARLGVAGRRR